MHSVATGQAGILPGTEQGTATSIYYGWGAKAGIIDSPPAGLLIDANGTYRPVFLFGPIFIDAGPDLDPA